MGWKFWTIENKNDQILNPRSSNLPKPENLPDRVGIYLVTQLRLHPDWVWELKAVVRPTTERQSFEIRIFDPREALISDVFITDFNCLDDYPELILFEGFINRNTGGVEIKRTTYKAA